MDLHQARNILDAVRAGDTSPTWLQIRQALTATGDLVSSSPHIIREQTLTTPTRNLPSQAIPLDPITHSTWIRDGETLSHVIETLSND